MLSKIAREFPFASFRGEFFVDMSNPVLMGVGGFGMRRMLAPCLAVVNKLLIKPLLIKPREAANRPLAVRS
jgi:hypothetical protein